MTSKKSLKMLISAVKTWDPKEFGDLNSQKYVPSLEELNSIQEQKEPHEHIQNFIDQVLYWFTAASTRASQGDSFLFHRFYLKALYSAFSLRAFLQTPDGHWKYPPNAIKLSGNEVEKRFMENLVPPISKEQSNDHKRDFIAWFDDLIDRTLERYPSLNLSPSPEKIIAYLEGIYRRDYLQNFRGAIGINNVFRSPNPALFLEETPLLKDFLQKNDITLVVDLRGQAQHDKDPYCDEYLAKMGIQLLLVDFNEPSLTEAGLTYEDRIVYTNYVRKVHCLRGAVKEIFTNFVKTPGAALFHCAAGKDRTGVIVSLFQLLGDVSTKKILEGYKLSGHDSTPDRIQAVLDYIESAEHGGGKGIEAYLDACGISQSVINAAKEKIKR